MTPAGDQPRISDDELRAVDELASSCKSGLVQRVIELLQMHPNVLDSPDRDERFQYPSSQLWSPLYLAAMNGHEELVHMLLELGANPVPYEVAAQYHHLTYGDWMTVLLERGYDRIHHAIESSLQQRYGLIIEPDAIRQAVIDGNIDDVRSLLIDKPELVSRVDAVGNTLLHHAVAANRLDMVSMLIEHGAAVDPRNGDGRTPSVVALFGLHRYWRDDRKQEILEYLLEQGAAYTLLIAATIGDETRVRELVAVDPAQVNHADLCNRRPLSGAVAGGHTTIIRLLLAHGADPNAKEAICQGGLSLRIAAEKGDVHIVRMLLENGASPNHWVDSSGDAMYIAFARGHHRVLQMLYAFGGSMELQVYAAYHRIDVIAEVLRLQPSRSEEVLPYSWEDNGSEDLAYDIMKLAIRYGARFENASTWNLKWTVIKYPTVFKLLQQYGANPDLTLLSLAGDMSRRYKDQNERLQAIEFLIDQCNANVNCQDEDGFTPLAKAAQEGYIDIVELLLARGAERRTGTNTPEWAQSLYVAEKNGHADIVSRLHQQ